MNKLKEEVQKLNAENEMLKKSTKEESKVSNAEQPKLKKVDITSTVDQLETTLANLRKDTKGWSESEIEAKRLEN